MSEEDFRALFATFIYVLQISVDERSYAVDNMLYACTPPLIYDNVWKRSTVKSF